MDLWRGNQLNATSNNNSIAAILSRYLLEQQRSPQNRSLSSRPLMIRLESTHPPKVLSSLQLIEICALCFILIEHTFVFILTFEKKSTKEILLNTNDQQQRQAHQPRSIVLSSKSLLYNCLHRNWTRAYSFSNICLSFVYFTILMVTHKHPNLDHTTSTTFYSLPLALLQQILINFSGFHLFIIAISILQHFIRYYRLLRTKYSLNIYSGKTLLITKHTNVALILSGSLALIFGYNYIFYTPKYPITASLLPLITLNMTLLPVVDLLIMIFIGICCCVDLHGSLSPMRTNWSFNDQPSQQCLASNLRSTIERTACIKCYSKFLQQNRNLFRDNDAYSRIHANLFARHLNTSSRPSIASPEQLRKYSTASGEVSTFSNDAHSHLTAASSSHPVRASASNLSARSPDFASEQRMESERIAAANELILQTTLLKLKRQRSLCHLCYRLLLIFLLKYVLFTFPHHFIYMRYYLRQFYDYLVKHNVLHTKSSNSDIQHMYTAQTILLCRFLFLFARFGDSLLLTRLPHLVKNYFPCWCQCNSQLLRDDNSVQRPSHQILMRNTDTSTNDPTSGEDLSFLNDATHHQQQLSATPGDHRRLRLRFQFMPLWSKKQQRLFKSNY